MGPQEPDPIGQDGVVGHDHATVAEAAEVLGRVEAQDSPGGRSTRRAPLVLRTDRLRRVLDHDEAGLLGDRHDRVHVGDLAVEVHGDDGAGLLGDRRRDVLGVEL